LELTRKEMVPQILVAQNNKGTNSNFRSEYPKCLVLLFFKFLFYLEKRREEKRREDRKRKKRKKKRKKKSRERFTCESFAFSTR